MKVLHVIPRIAPSQGGLRTGTIAICRAMRAAGIEPEIACLEEPDGEDPPDIPVTRFKPGMGLLGSSDAMRRWLLDNAGFYGAIVAHVVWLNPASYAAEAATRAGVPFLIASRGMLDPDAMQHHRVRKLARWHMGLRRRVQRAVLVFTSEEDRDRTLLHPDLKNVPNVVVPNPVQKIDPAPEDRPPVVLCLNRMHERKGVREFVRALKTLRGEGLEFRGVHAGHPEQAKYSERVIREGRDVVDFLGPLAHDEARELIQRAAIVVHPARGYENFGNVIAEGMMAGKAVVASPRALAAPELGRRGMLKLAEPEARDIAARVRVLLEDDEMRRELGQRARAYALEHFSYGRVGELWREVLNYARHSVPDEPV